MGRRAYYDKQMNGGRILGLGTPVGLSDKQAVDTNSTAVNVKWVGAKGDATTDDTAAIQYAIDNRDYIYIPKGVYLVSGLNLRSGVKVFGEGASSILKANTDTARVINVYSAGSVITDVQVCDLRINGGGQTTDKFTGIKRAYGVYISNAQNVKIERLIIEKCGVMHPTTVINDVNHGGYGILAESRNGEIRNVRISSCTITDIAGGGMQMGDGILINGFNSNTSIVPHNIVVENCHVERVGRHCYSVGGENPESLSRNVYMNNLYGKSASLCGIDFEEGIQCVLDGFKFENCGNYTYYYDMSSITEYGAQYHLSSGVAFGNLCEGTIIRNGFISGCNYGLTFGGASNVLYDTIRIENSTQSDMALRLARMGDNTILYNVKCMTTGKTVSPFYSSSDTSNILVDSCYFASQVNLPGIKYARFNNCVFNSTFNFTSVDNTKNEFVGCKFNQNVEFTISDGGFHTFDKCRFLGSKGMNFGTNGTYVDNVQVVLSEFRGNQYGIYSVWTSLKNMKVDNCKFIGNTVASIYHANSNNETPFLRISGNTFLGTVDGILINQAIKYAKISENTFRNVTGWCIANQNIFSGTSTTDFQILNNQAVSGCANGIQIQVATGSHDYNIISGNNMRICTGTKASISAGNSNGFQTQNFF
ncbi:glycosyl hydrolase family 28-related protein [Runella limosa]|uniref:glycosyl hydrolase family 28-related protein n=1 Tax=Runella limosa TaxID=370978 RepID=UPI00048C48DF|nr:glycosyl hydrolase family 28-related protein [Runella limosa]